MCLLDLEEGIALHTEVNRSCCAQEDIEERIRYFACCQEIRSVKKWTLNPQVFSLAAGDFFFVVVVTRGISTFSPISRLTPRVRSWAPASSSWPRGAGGWRPPAVPPSARSLDLEPGAARTPGCRTSSGAGGGKTKENKNVVEKL